MQTCSVRAHLNWNNMAIMNEQNEEMHTTYIKKSGTRG